MKLRYSIFYRGRKLTVPNRTKNQTRKERNMANSETITNPSATKVRNFPCEKCPHRGTTKKVLKEHSLTKYDGVKFPCKECPFVSATTATRYMHNLTKHKGLKFECNICNKEFADPSSLRKHKKYTHKGICYNCNNCDYARVKLIKSSMKLKYILK